MNETTRIHVRLGANEFDAEGPIELVQQQYEEFLALVSAGERLPVTRANVRLSAKTIKAAFTSLCPATSVPLPVPSFSLDQPDFLLAVLYGALAISDISAVSASDLMALLKYKGLASDPERIDRLFSIHSGLIRKTGIRRGSKYALTQEGVGRAERLIALHLLKKQKK